MRSANNNLSLLTLFIYAASVFAFQGHGWCLTGGQAQQVATNFADLLTEYSGTLANETLTSNYNDYSDSVCDLIDGGGTSPCTLGSVTFASRAAFESGQGTQPAIPFQQLNIWNTCNTVIIRWVSAQSPEQVTGITALEVTPAPKYSKVGPYLIETVYSEFNSGAWLGNIGCSITNCPAAPAGSKAKREISFSS